MTLVTAVANCLPQPLRTPPRTPYNNTTPSVYVTLTDKLLVTKIHLTRGPTVTQIFLEFIYFIMSYILSIVLTL